MTAKALSALRRRLNRTAKIAAGLIVLLVIARLALPSAVKWYVNRKLDELPGYVGQVSEIGIDLSRGAYKIRGIQVQKVSERDQPPVPFIEIRQADLSVEWYLYLQATPCLRGDGAQEAASYAVASISRCNCPIK